MVALSGRTASSAALDDAARVFDTTDQLVEAVSQHMTCIDGYERFIEAADPSQPSFAAEPLHRQRVLKSEEALRQALHDSRPAAAPDGLQKLDGKGPELLNLRSVSACSTASSQPWPPRQAHRRA